MHARLPLLHLSSQSTGVWAGRRAELLLLRCCFQATTFAAARFPREVRTKQQYFQGPPLWRLLGYTPPLPLLVGLQVRATDLMHLTGLLHFTDLPHLTDLNCLLTSIACWPAGGT